MSRLMPTESETSRSPALPPTGRDGRRWDSRIPDTLLLRIDRPDPDSQILLTSPRLIDASPFYLRLSYEVEFRGRKITAFCEVAHPHRLNWPILGRMIEMSIESSCAGQRRELRVQQRALPISKLEK